MVPPMHHVGRCSAVHRQSEAGLCFALCISMALKCVLHSQRHRPDNLHIGPNSLAFVCGAGQRLHDMVNSLVQVGWTANLVC